MSDKETLLSMGFAQDRIECECSLSCSMACCTLPPRHTCRRRTFQSPSSAELIKPPGAMRATKNAGLQPAMDHILANSEKPVPTAAEQADDDDDGGAANIPDVGEAKSIKCSECGKIFRSSASASFHAEKSGHQDFEESTEEVSRGGRGVRCNAGCA